MLRVLATMALLALACAPRSAPSSSPSSSPAASDPRLAACERDEWAYCWMRALDGSIPGAHMARYRAGCHGNDSGDCMRLGIFTTDVDARGRLFQRACDGGLREACDALPDAWVAMANARRDPDERSALLARAHAAYEASCARGDAGACSSLATAYAAGDGVVVDAERARTYARRSCALAKIDPCAVLIDVECALGGTCPERP